MMEMVRKKMAKVPVITHGTKVLLDEPSPMSEGMMPEGVKELTVWLFW